MAFTVYKQRDGMDCGPTCLRMITNHYGLNVNIRKLRDLCECTRTGSNLQGLSNAAEELGFRTLGVSVDPNKLLNQAPLPFIAHWKQEHFIVVYKANKRNVYIADPAFGKIKYTRSEFLTNWLSHEKNGERHGVALLLEPSIKLNQKADEGEKDALNDGGFSFLYKYLLVHKKLVYQLGLGMIVGSLLQLLLPFFAQSIVDFGINQKDISFLYLILIAQAVLFFSRTVVDFIRNWILLHIGQRINIALVSDFLIKLMRMPISYFDSKMVGDIMQRIGDHKRIEIFLTASTLNVLFSMFNLIIFSVALALYSYKILLLFIVGSALYAIWVLAFLKKRRELDFKRFDKQRQTQDSIFQIILGMQELKLYNSERQKRWEWERIQARLFQVNVASLKLTQFQQAGAVFINEGKNILITFLAAYSVINGEITLGMMLSIQFIIGQLNSPIEQLIQFMQTSQDAKISLERLSEIHNQRDEEEGESSRLNELPPEKSLTIDQLSFRYAGMQDQFALENVTLKIPQGKTTAIVGTSGSGKTTLLKMLLGFYEPQGGSIKLGGVAIDRIKKRTWRDHCGVVMQDGYIFSDSIERNICLGDDHIDRDRLIRAVDIANIREYIESLPMGYQTKIGSDGRGLSAGQKQRLLIARSVYKDPEFIFFDEATNALDANNESAIVDKLSGFFKGKTVVVVAHRLSTVKHADQIIVLEKGKVVEIGSHQSLCDANGDYYRLVKNQLELGN